MRLSNKLNDIKKCSNIICEQDIITDLVTSFVGKYIGSGSYRDVYEYNFNDDYVIKLEKDNTEQNISEYILWQEINSLNGDLRWVKDWFAPVLWCSPNGKILVMEKTKINDKKAKPEKIPIFLSDVKIHNFGWIGNKYVCHDYGMLDGFIKCEKKFKKIIW